MDNHQKAVFWIKIKRKNTAREKERERERERVSENIKLSRGPDSSESEKRWKWKTAHAGHTGRKYWVKRKPFFVRLWSLWGESQSFVRSRKRTLNFTRLFTADNKVMEFNCYLLKIFQIILFKWFIWPLHSFQVYFPLFLFVFVM